jgi:hypothetical protein
MGVGLGLALGAVGALSGRGLRPVAKAAIKGGLIAYQRASVAAAEAAEVAQDLYHEAREEREAEEQARERLPHGGDDGGNGVVPMRGER